MLSADHRHAERFYAPGCRIVRKPPQTERAGHMANSSAEPTAPEPQSSAIFGRGTLAVTIGNMLEFYDFITYSFFAVQIGHTFFPSTSQFGSLMASLATFGVGFVTRPIGGIVIGYYSDRAGRRPA